jgi:hypothetical protein
MDIWDKPAIATCKNFAPGSKKRSADIVFDFPGNVCGSNSSFFFYANREPGYLFYYSHPVPDTE